jgi:hypothetical protein
MTAIVGVLNKHAVAIAADSAVTLGGGRKVMNGANKLFALSKYHPVAIAIYGNAEFIGTPWEIIIKEYRKQLKDKSFPTLRMYVDDFQRFLKRRKYFCSEKEANDYLKSSVQGLYLNILQICKNHPDRIDNVLSRLEQSKTQPLLGGFKDETVTFFNEEVKKEIENGCKMLQTEGITVDIVRMKEIIEAVFTRDVIPLGTTGLVFAGYGESEIFPSIYNCNVGCVIKGLLAKVVKNASRINKDNLSGICPFAQTDVMHTILDGVSPKMHEVYLQSLEQTFVKMKNALASLAESSYPELASQIRGLDITPFGTEFLKMSKTTQMKEYTMPFVRSVATLEKEDLADFAESLITLTSLKRKVSFDQETVGGPVDVMVISKGDGIIWMKRKHYFDPDKNHHFFSNYFNL